MPISSFHFHLISTVFITFSFSELHKGLRKYIFPIIKHTSFPAMMNDHTIFLFNPVIFFSLASSSLSWPRKIIIQIPTNVENGWASSRLAATAPAPASLLHFDHIPTASETKWNGKHQQNNNKWKNDEEMAMERRRRRKENCLTIFFLVTQQ